ncbi:MAG: 4a-hydroxytetrahydrobiopterin dehydratase [Myxococcales bacterium]|nr:4a-hydroxytetrahydrobiopterin dehydratase [Myxococcales bacterium]
MAKLSEQHCEPCRGGIPPLKGEQILQLHTQLDGGWEVVDEHHLTKTFPFPDFLRGLAFVNAVAAVAEAAGHHPDVFLAWGRVRLEIYTHKIDGLHLADFVLAAKCEDTFRGLIQS